MGTQTNVAINQWNAHLSLHNNMLYKIHTIMYRNLRTFMVSLLVTPLLVIGKPATNSPMRNTLESWLGLRCRA